MIGISACVEIGGGAAELSWSIRAPDGSASACNLRERSGADRPDIVEVALCWETFVPGQEVSLACNRDRREVFECTRSRGATQFRIDSGTTALWVEPLCSDGQPLEPGLVEVPAPLVRDVGNGQVVTLDALLIVADAQACVRDTPL